MRSRCTCFECFKALTFGADDPLVIFKLVSGCALLFGFLVVMACGGGGPSNGNAACPNVASNESAAFQPETPQPGAPGTPSSSSLPTGRFYGEPPADTPAPPSISASQTPTGVVITYRLGEGPDPYLLDLIVRSSAHRDLPPSEKKLVDPPRSGSVSLPFPPGAPYFVGATTYSRTSHTCGDVIVSVPQAG